MMMMYTYIVSMIYSNLMVGVHDIQLNKKTSWKNRYPHPSRHSVSGCPWSYIQNGHILFIFGLPEYIYFVFEHVNSFYVLICRTIIHNRVITANWNKIKYDFLGNIESKTWEILVNWFDINKINIWSNVFCLKKSFFASYLRN